MMNQVIQYAKLGGYAGIYIPTNANIHSNRAGIQKIIQNAGYPVITLDNPVNPSTLHLGRIAQGRLEHPPRPVSVYGGV